MKRPVFLKVVRKPIKRGRDKGHENSDKTRTFQRFYRCADSENCKPLSHEGQCTIHICSCGARRIVNRNTRGLPLPPKNEPIPENRYEIGPWSKNHREPTKGNKRRALRRKIDRDFAMLTKEDVDKVRGIILERDIPGRMLKKMKNAGLWP
jgi:hypothetical protein